MKIKPFATEQYFALYEFTSRYPLSVSDCETLSVEELLRLAGISVDEFAKTRLAYTESSGEPDLRRAIAGGYRGVAPNDVIYLGAPVEGIYLAMRTLLEPGDEVIVLRPAYDALINMVEHVAGGFVPWDLTAGDGRWELDFDWLEAKVSGATRMIVVNFPHNPTGFLPTPEQFERLVRICGDHDVVLFCDEMYRGLELEPTPRLESAADAYDSSVTLSGLSKTYGLPGLRSGWLVVRDPAINAELMNWKHYTTICSSATGQRLALAGLAVRDELAAKNREIVERNLRTADRFFDRHAALFEWRRPAAASVALVGVRSELLAGISVGDYCHWLAKEHGVLLLPGECLGADYLTEGLLTDGAEDDVAGYVRFGFGRESFAESLAAYDELLSRRPV